SRSPTSQAADDKSCNRCGHSVLSVFRSPMLPRATIDLRSDGALPADAPLNELAQAFAAKSIALVPKGTKFAFAVPTSQVARLQSIKLPEENNPSPAEVFPVGLIKFTDA